MKSGHRLRAAVFRSWGIFEHLPCYYQEWSVWVLMYWNPAAQKVGMRPSVQNNYTKKEITLLPKYTPLYVWRLYGDLEAELDFPSCEISFCSPAGQLHHFPCFPIFHSRLSSHPCRCGGLLKTKKPWCSMVLPASCYMLPTPVVAGGKSLSSACAISTALHQPQGLKYHNIKPLWSNAWMHPVEAGRDTSLCLWKWIRGSTNVKRHTWKRSLQFLSGIKGSFSIIWNGFCQVEKKWMPRRWDCPSTIWIPPTEVAQPDLCLCW